MLSTPAKSARDPGVPRIARYRLPDGWRKYLRHEETAKYLDDIIASDVMQMRDAATLQFVMEFDRDHFLRNLYTYYTAHPAQDPERFQAVQSLVVNEANRRGLRIVYHDDGAVLSVKDMALRLWVDLEFPDKVPAVWKNVTSNLGKH